MAIRRREEILKRSRQMERHRRSLRQIVLSVLLVILIGASLIAVNLNAFAIKSVLVRGAGNTPSGDIELLARKGITGSYLYLVPRASVFFYPRALLTKSIFALSPRIASVRMHVSAARTLVIDIAERSPRYLWCGTGTDCLYLDENGFAFAHAFSGNGLPYPIFSIGSTTPVLEHLALPSSTFLPLSHFVDTLPVKAERIRVEGERSEITVNGGYRLIVNSYTDFTAARRNLSVTLASQELTGPLSQGKTLQYIDLRVPEKVFYKF